MNCDCLNYIENSPQAVSLEKVIFNSEEERLREFFIFWSVICFFEWDLWRRLKRTFAQIENILFLRTIPKFRVSFKYRIQCNYCLDIGYNMDHLVLDEQKTRLLDCIHFTASASAGIWIYVINHGIYDPFELFKRTDWSDIILLSKLIAVIH